MRQVLEERKIDTNGMRAPDMRLVLGAHTDFKYEKTALEHFMQERGGPSSNISPQVPL